MPKWDPEQYLRFEQERTLPARDLLARIAGRAPERIVDLGCGTGTSTALLHERWPGAELTGLDSSPEMIDAARAREATVEWVVGDIRTWRVTVPYDLIFSNAALHWLPDHEELFPRLLQQLAPGGRLAVQMPTHSDSPAHRSVREVAATPRWSSRWAPDPARSHVLDPDRYYDLLAPGSSQVDLWQTEYLHILPGPSAILEWIKGTTLRPYLDVLPSPEDQEAFLGQIERKLEGAYPPRSDGRVVFPFRRLFFVATR
jgi:trans-aconitate 2-methyltransferase